MWLVLAGLASAVPAYSDAYKWRDASGQTHYGDKPPKGVADVERVDTLECVDEACVEEQERRRQLALENQRQLEEWLDKREADRAQAPPEKVYVPMYYAPPPVVITPWYGGYGGGVLPAVPPPLRPYPHHPGTAVKPHPGGPYRSDYRSSHRAAIEHGSLGRTDHSGSRSSHGFRLK